MRTFRLLATSLLVALSMGVSSCSEELDSQPMESYPEGGQTTMFYRNKRACPV